MTWLFIDGTSIDGEVIEVEGESAHYLGRVLRARPGDPVTLFDGRGRTATASVRSLSGASAVVERRGDIARVPRPAEKLCARIALIKGERMDWCIQKLTELGVDDIELFCAERSVVKWSEERADKRLRRYRGIIRSAGAQSERPWLPVLRGPGGAGGDVGPGDDTIDLALFCRRELPRLSQLAASPTRSLRFTIGPEGGFTPDEQQELCAAGWRGCTLGEAILRAETAALASATLLAAALGRLG